MSSGYSDSADGIGKVVTSDSPHHQPAKGGTLDAWFACRRLKLLTLLLAFGFALVFLAASISSPFEGDQDPYFAGVIRDVVRNGHWIAPRDSYGEICRKPPLYFWLSALAVELYGGRVDETSSRAVSVIAAAGVASLTLAVASAELGAFAGLMAYLFLLGSYGFASRAARAEVDALMVLCFFVAVILAAKLDDRGSNLGRALATALALGLGVLTKGPVVLVLSALTLLVWRVMRRLNPLGLFAQKSFWIAWFGGLAIGGVWYILAWRVWRDELVSVHMMQENLGHFLPASMGGTGEAYQPFYFPTVKLIAGSLPMALGLPALTLALTHQWRRGGEHWSFLSLHASLVIAVLGFFSLASSKRPVYVLPAYPSMAVMLAWVFAQASDNRETGSEVGSLCRKAQSLAVLGFGLMLGFLVLLTMKGAFVSKLVSHLAPTDAGYVMLLTKLVHQRSLGFLAFVVATTIIVAVTSAALWRGLYSVSTLGIGLLALTGVGLWLDVLKPAHAYLYSLKSFVAEISRIADSSQVYVLGGENYQVSFYWGGPVPVFRPESLREFAGGKFYIVGLSRELSRLALPEHYRLVLRQSSGVYRAGSDEIVLAQVVPVGERTTAP